MFFPQSKKPLFTPTGKTGKIILHNQVFSVLESSSNDELHSLYSSPNIVRVIKSRRMRWAGHVASMGEEFWLGGPKVRDHWEDLGVGVR
jgi:hypothetical protein